MKKIKKHIGAIRCTACKQPLIRDCSGESDYNPDYAVSPMDTLAEFCLYSTFGTQLVERFEKEGITEHNVYFITALFPKTSRSFWINLQLNYNEIKENLG